MSNVRQMMKEKGRKVDMKALKEAKRAKLAMLSKENEIKERKLQKEREREMFNSTMAPPPPPPKVMGPPPTKRVLPSNFFDNVSSNNSMPPPPPPQTKTPSAPVVAAGTNLPAGFFDSEEMETQEVGSSNPLGLVGYGSNDSDNSDGEDDNEDSATSSLIPESSESNHNRERGGATASAIPEGFFDDADADMRARGVEPEVVATAQKDAEIDEFMAFAEKVGESSAQTDEMSADIAKETARMSSVEQALYMNRVAKLLQKVDTPQTALSKASKHKNNKLEEKEESQESINVLETIELHNSDENQQVLQDVHKMVSGRKKKRKAAKQAADECDYVPLDPTNWRAKTF